MQQNNTEVIVCGQFDTPQTDIKHTSDESNTSKRLENAPKSEKKIANETTQPQISQTMSPAKRNDQTKSKDNNDQQTINSTSNENSGNSPSKLEDELKNKNINSEPMKQKQLSIKDFHLKVTDNRDVFFSKNMQPYANSPSNFNSEPYANSPSNFNSEPYAKSPYSRQSYKKTPPDVNDQKDKLIKKNQSSIKIVTSTYYSIVPLLIVLISVMCSFNYNQQPSEVYSEKIMKSESKNLKIFHSGNNMFDENIRVLKLKYPNLTSKFWANIESTYRHSVIKSRDPSIVLIANEKSDSRIAYNITFDILKLVKTSIDDKSNLLIKNLIINSSDLHNAIRDSNRLKLEIDNKLNNLFSNGQKVALIRNIEFIPAEVMLLFMSYGDDFLNAKYPGVMILMTLEVDKLEINDRDSFLKSSKQMTQYIESYLFDLWSKSLGEDQLKPIFTRIANNVIFV